MRDRPARAARPFEAARRAVRDHVAGEDILALGRASASEELPEPLPGSTTTIVAVTPSRIMWTRRDAHAPLEELAWDAVRGWREASQGHRSALVLDHDPIERLVWAPAHRFLWARWGNSETARPVSRAVFAFSRRDTEVADAMRAHLAARAIPAGEPIALGPASDRVAGRAPLTAAAYRRRGTRWPARRRARR